VIIEYSKPKFQRRKIFGKARANESKFTAAAAKTEKDGAWPSFSIAFCCQG